MSAKLDWQILKHGGDCSSIEEFIDSGAKNGFICLKFELNFPSGGHGSSRTRIISARMFVRRGMRYRNNKKYTFFEIGTVACWPRNCGGFKLIIKKLKELRFGDGIYVESIHSAVLLDYLPRIGFIEDPLDRLSMYYLWEQEPANEESN